MPEMMQYKLVIDVENDAFRYCKKEEIARILEEAARQLRKDNAYTQYMRDANGNIVGMAGMVARKVRPLGPI